MSVLQYNVAILAVMALYFIWRIHAGLIACRARRLRERVAYLLWVAAGVGRGNSGEVRRPPLDGSAGVN